MNTLVDLLIEIRNLFTTWNVPPFEVEDFNVPGEHVTRTHFDSRYRTHVPALEFRVKHSSGKIFVVSVREER